MSFEVKIPLFEGPFDLLLFFIERDELDIYDIPISRITNDFLAYLKDLEKLNMEVASEFILVAAKLMRIKVKMLLPRPQLDDDGREIDPREELVKHLLEYKKYKSVVLSLSDMEFEMMQREKRGNLTAEIKNLSEGVNVESELQDLDLYKLLRVFQKVLVRFETAAETPTHKVVQYPFTIAQQKDFILKKLHEKKKLSFVQVMEYDGHRLAVIYNFLAILELLQLQLISLRLGEGYNNFWISAKEPVEEKLAE